MTADGKALVTQLMDGEDALWVTYPDQGVEPLRITAEGPDFSVSGISWTPDGRIVYGGTAMDGMDLWISEAGSGKRAQITFGGTSSYPSVSPDGRYIVYQSSTSSEDHIWRIDPDGANPVQLTFGEGESDPKCHPDGQSVYYLGNAPGGHLLFRVPIQGGDPEQVSDRILGDWTLAISPDGSRIAVRTYDDKSNEWQVEIIQHDGGETSRSLDLKGYIFQWSPDGKALNYVKFENGIGNIWSHPLNGDPPRFLVGRQADWVQSLEWAPDGKALAVEVRNNSWDVVLLKDFR